MQLPRMMMLSEAAERARISERTLLTYIADGAGPTVTKFRGRTVIREDHYLAWLDRNARSGGQQAA